MENLLPLCGKTAETGFHAMELFPKLASMPWKTGESGFHAVENQRYFWGSRTED
jgi:hypothetical protein